VDEWDNCAEERNSIDVILECVALREIEGLKLESVKSHTRIWPSEQATYKTAGRVRDQAPAVR